MCQLTRSMAMLNCGIADRNFDNNEISIQSFRSRTYIRETDSPQTLSFDLQINKNLHFMFNVEHLDGHRRRNRRPVCTG